MSSRLEPVARLLDAVIRKDFEGLKSVLHPDVRFRALAPGESVDVGTADEAARVFRRWFADKDGLELVDSEAGPIVDRAQLRYRLRLLRNGEPCLVEHRLFGDLEEERFVSLDLLCSGFRPCGPAPAQGSVHRFEAGELGCATGLPREFRARLVQIPIGHLLEVRTRDAAAKEDLPALARMLGQRVVAIDAGPDGQTRICVERVK